MMKKPKFNLGRGPPLEITPNQRNILNELAQATDGLLGSDIAKRVGLTPAGAFYLLKPLVAAELVGRQPMPGGGVLYYMTANVRTQLSKEMQKIVAGIEAELGRKLLDTSVKELREVTKRLDPDDRRSLMTWIFGGF